MVPPEYKVPSGSGFGLLGVVGEVRGRLSNNDADGLCVRPIYWQTRADRVQHMLEANFALR